VSHRLLALTGGWLVGLALCVVAVWLVATSDHAEAGGVSSAIAIIAGASFVATGLIATWRRPDNRTGPLMAATGYAWLLSALAAANTAWVFTTGFVLGSLSFAMFAHLVLAFPTGRLERDLHRRFAAAVYATALFVPLGLALTDNTDDVCGSDCPESVIAVVHGETAGSVVNGVGTVVVVVLIAGLLVLVADRWRRATPALRRALGGVFFTSGVTFALLLASLAAAPFSSEVALALEYGVLGAFATVPIAFLLGVLRSRLARSAAGDVLMRLGEGVPLLEALADALHDPSLQIGYRLEGPDRYVDAEGEVVRLDEPDRATKRVERLGRPIAVLVHDPTLLDEPELVEAVATAAGLWLDNERLQAETRAQYRFLETIVDTAPSLLVNVDTDGRIRNFNAASERASGLDDPEQLRGQVFWEVFIDPADREELRARFAAAAPRFEASEYENTFTNAHGRQLVIAWSTAPLVDERGETIGVIAGGLDITERKRKELQLEASKERLRAAIDASPVAIVELDLDGIVGTWNPAAERIFGWAPEELLGTMLPLVPPDRKAEAADLDEQVLRGVPQSGLETIRVRKDGTPVEVEISAAPVRDAAGAVVGSMALYVDITERKRQERARRASEQRLTAVIDSAPVAVIEVGLDGRIRRWNPAAEQIFGWTAEEATSGPLPLVPEEQRPDYEALVAKVRAGHSYTGHETQRRRKDGTLVDVGISSAPIRDASGSVTGHMVLIADITERKQREEELRGERDFLDQLGDTIPSLLVLADREGVIVRDGANRAFRETLGRTTEDTQLHSFLEFVHPDDGYATLMAIAAAANGVARADLEGRWLRSDGEPVPIAWSATPITHPSDPNLVLITGVDITQRYLQEEAVRASRARLVEAGDAERRRLERNLHDGAQQRLVALSLSLRLAESRLGADEGGARELLAAAREELALAIDELRELARGIHPAVLTDRGLSAAVDALVGRCGVPVETDVLDERLPPPVEAAAYYVVAESLTNIAKYAEATEAGVRIASDDGVVSVEVSDDGVGGADLGSGSGLRGLVDRVAALDGTLTVDSPPGGGTRIVAEIPVRERVLAP
jgi:PAS domain S-box-containing protein